MLRLFHSILLINILKILIAFESLLSMLPGYVHVLHVRLCSAVHSSGLITFRIVLPTDIHSVPQSRKLNTNRREGQTTSQEISKFLGGQEFLHENDSGAWN